MGCCLFASGEHWSAYYPKELVHLDTNLTSQCCFKGVRDDTLLFHNLVQLRTRAMENDGIQPHAREKTQTVRELVQLVEHRSPDLDDREFGGMVRIGGGREDAEVSFDLFLGSDGV